MNSICGCILRAYSFVFSTSNSTCGSKSVLLMMHRSALRKMVGYLIGADHHNALCLTKVEQGRTHQVAHVFDEQQGVGIR